MHYRLLSGVARGADDAMALAALLDDLDDLDGTDGGGRGGGGKKGKKDVSSGKDAKAKPKTKGTSSSSSSAASATASSSSSSSSCFDAGGAKLTTKPQPLSLVLSDAMLGGLDCPYCQDHVGVVLVADAAGLGPGLGSGLEETTHQQGGQGSAGCLVCRHQPRINYDYAPSDTPSLFISVCLAILPGVRSRHTLRRRCGRPGPRAVAMGYMHYYH